MPTVKPFSNFFSQTDPSIFHDITTVTDYLTQYYNATCYVVGGAVRDRLLGLACKDYDIECFGINVEDFESAMEHLGALGVGKSFYVYKYHLLDISLPRKEKKVSQGHQGFEVSLVSNEREASKRRDFTINALMYDIQNEKILDFWSGLDDLEHKMLRVVNESSFMEDSLRVLRAMQFSARFGFKIEEKSCTLCQKITLDDLPKERIFIEFEKMFRAGYLHYGLYYLIELGIFEKLFDARMEGGTFMQLARVLQKYQGNFEEELRDYYFLFISLGYWGIETGELLDRLGAPNVYYKKLATSLPTALTVSFIANLALKEGIVSYVGNYHPKVRRLAKHLKVWDKPFDRGVTATELMSEGFLGKALGDELERRTQVKINRLKEK